jgi:uridine monophosphate synthetase
MLRPSEHHPSLAGEGQLVIVRNGGIMESFFRMLEYRVQRVGSLLCVGLDPHPQDLLSPTGSAAKDFCLRLIDATEEVAAAYKPNAAFFEALGADGWTALREIIAAVPAGIPVILDAKRGDISSTAQAYAQSAFKALGADAITLSPYLGFDSLQPFLQEPQRGVFLLCKTSNPSAADLQDLALKENGVPLYQKVALLAQAWNHHDNLGIVVGATQPDALRKVRSLAPGLWILAPGVGFQGGDLAQSLLAGLRQDGMGLLIPVSRAISRAEDPGKIARELRDEIQRARQQALERQPAAAKPAQTNLEKVAEGLLQAGCVRFGSFTLKSGIQSPIYIDLRQLVSFPELLKEVASAYIPILKDLQYDRIAGLPYAAIPIATAISLQTSRPMLYPRKEVKEYGTQASIEGHYQAGERVVLIDDLATTGGSKFEAIQKLEEAGLIIKDVVVLIDRQSGADQALAQSGYHLHAVFTIGQLLDYWEVSGHIPAEQIKTAREFLENQS